MRRTSLALASLLAGAGALSAQDAPFHATFLGDYDVAGNTYADVWADGDVVYMGRFGLNVVDVIDVSNPAAPFLITSITVPSPNNGCSAQDVKIGPSAVDPGVTLAFVAFDAIGPDAFGIYDVTNPASPDLLTTVQPNTYFTSHNTSYRPDGWVATCNSFTSDLALIDLTGYDPDNPPATILNWDYQLANLGTGFVHDITLTDEYLFVSQWDSLIVYDASNLDGGPPVFLGEITGYSSHAVWPSADNTYVVTTDERQGGAIRLFEMIDNGSSVALNPLDSWVPPGSGLNAAYSAHNPVFLGNRVYVSSYNAGVLVFQVDPSSKTFEKVASFDTSTVAPAGFDGCWGVYPFLGEQKVILSDLQEGLVIVDMSALELRPPTDRPLTVSPFTTNTVQVEIEELGTASLDAGSPTLFVSVDGAPFSSSALSNVGGNLWEGTLPAVSCGSRIDYFFGAETIGAEQFSAPADAPTSFFTTYATVALDPVFQDDFESDLGWTVTNVSLSDGGWERDVPVGSGMAPDEDDWRDAGTRCYVTGNGVAFGGVGDDDVDGGPTQLVSPQLDFDFGDGLISYSLWHATGDGDPTDALVVEFSDDNGSSWVPVETVTMKAGGWLRHGFRVSDYGDPNSDVRIRFSMSDQPNNGIAEAAIDNVTAELFCASPSAGAAFRNGSGANATCFVAFPPILGQQWNSIVTHSGHPGASATVVVFFPTPTSGVFIKAGEVLVDLGSGKLLQSILPATGSSDQHSFPVPADISVLGVTASVQAGILGGAGAELCNAYDITVGF